MTWLSSSAWDLQVRSRFDPLATPRAEKNMMTSGLSSLIKDRLAGGASRLAALLLRQILPVSSVVAPCHPGAALRDPVLVQRGRATSVPIGGAFIIRQRSI